MIVSSVCFDLFVFSELNYKFFCTKYVNFLLNRNILIINFNKRNLILLNQIIIIYFHYFLLSNKS